LRNFAKTYFAKWFRRNFAKFCETLWVFCEILSWYRQILISRNDFAEISQNTFCISRNFVVLLVLRNNCREILQKLISLNDFAEILRNTLSISRNFVVLLVLQKKFCEISSNTYFEKWFCWNFAKVHKISQNIFLVTRNFVAKLVSRNEISQNFGESLLHEISRNYLKNFEKSLNKNFAKFRFAKFSWPPYSWSDLFFQFDAY